VTSSAIGSSVIGEKDKQLTLFFLIIHPSSTPMVHVKEKFDFFFGKFIVLYQTNHKI